ncbi:MAG TPA: type I-E CRISPR-associated endonuclease Cas1 [Anaerolineales bacterium]|nr:type I-E CRISPR-associated endonuclease Cas1 [Anaerolineales bacterium]
MQDLHQLPKLSDSISYLYVEHCIIEQNALAIEKVDRWGRTMIPAANLTVLMIGPGTSITHAAIKSLAQNGCSIVWVGEDSTHFYAQGSGETRRAYHLLHQARLVSNPKTRLEVCKRMYRKRFQGQLDETLTIQQLRGKEGARVRTAYTQASIRYNVPWKRRYYNRQRWNEADPINRALSTANALLYGICHAAIVSGGYSPALGFIHTGKQRSFVFDIADLYKVDVTIPLAFRIVSEGSGNLNARVRKACREAFAKYRLLNRILPDIADILEVPESTLRTGAATDQDAARPEPLWDPIEEDPIDGDKSTPTSPQELNAPTKHAHPDKGEPHQTPTTAPVLKTIPHQRTEAETAKALQMRYARAQAGLENHWKVEEIKPHTWQVITKSGPPGYIVIRVDDYISCDCPDFDRNDLSACKHTMAVQILEERRAG